MLEQVPDGTAALQIEQGDARAWHFLPALLARVEKFCQRYDSEATTTTVLALIKSEFVKPFPGTVGWLWLSELGEPIGHMLLTIGEWMGTRIVTVLQFEVDRVPFPKQLGDAMMDWLDRFARANQAKNIHCNTRNEALARLFKRQYGFEKQMAMLSKPVSVTVRPIAAVNAETAAKEMSQ